MTSETPRYRLILWDFDGTLADTLANGVSVYNEIAQAEGYRVISDPGEFRSLETQQILKYLGIPFWKLPGLIRSYIRRQRDSMPNIRLFPGIGETIGSIASAGLTQGIVSSNAEESIRCCLKANDSDSFFRFVVGTVRLFGKHKAIAKAMSANHVAPGETLYIGDEVRDVIAARKIGVAVAAVTWGWHAEDALRESQPTFVMNSPEQIRDLLKC